MTAWLFDMLKHYLHRAITLPPHILMQKAVSKFKQAAHDKYKRYKDFKRPSFSSDTPQGILYSYLAKLDADHLLPHTKTILSVAKNYLDHRFDLFRIRLGSGNAWDAMSWFGRYCYDMGKPIKADSEEKWQR